MIGPLRVARLLVLLLIAGTASSLALAPSAGAEALPGGSEWRLEQPPPPAAGVGVEENVGVPVGLGTIGAVEFSSPNRGALITSGNGSTVKPGVWVYNGEAWHPLTAQTPEEGICGAANGRIAWAGPDEFWTVSNGRPGQAPGPENTLPPLEDNTLCHFAVNGAGQFEIVESYASLAFESTSYQAMSAAACVNASDCWFGGEVLPRPAVGSFQLHWNGSSVSEEPYLPEGHVVGDMQVFEGKVFESLRLSEKDLKIRHTLEVPALHVLGAGGAGEAVTGLAECLYSNNEDLYALDFLRLSADENALWAAAGSKPEPPSSKGTVGAGLTILHYGSTLLAPTIGRCEEEEVPGWRQVIGPDTSPSGSEQFPEEVASSIAAEPGTEDAWIGLETQVEAKEAESLHPSPIATGQLALVSAAGEVLDTLQLSLAKGAVTHIACPASHDCWVTTSAGWLFHLATDEERADPQPDGDPAFAGGYVITHRPEDEGVPPQTPTTLPVDDSGLNESRSGLEGVRVEPVAEEPFARVALPLLSHERTRLRHRTELELSFHLATEARIRLIAKRRGKIVASTPTRTLQAGNRSLLLRLNLKRWPTKLELKTHALGPLPTASTRENSAATNTVTYALSFPHASALLGTGPLGFGLRRCSSLAMRGGRIYRPLFCALALLGTLAALTVIALTGSPASSRAASPSASGEPTPQTDDSLPVNRVTMLGSSPGEASDETWGLGVKNGASVLVRYTPGTGWTLGPALLNSAGEPLSGFRLDQPEGGVYGYPSPLAGEIAANGAGALLGSVNTSKQVLLMRNPGGAFQETALPEGSEALAEGEALFGTNRAPMLTVLEEPAGSGGAQGHAGALVAPVDEAKGGEGRVLHWNGASWSGEPIEIPSGAEEFQTLAISASSPTNAWLLARISSQGAIGLFHRELGKGGESATWQPVAIKLGGEPGEPLTVPTATAEQKSFTVAARTQSQLLTASGEGVWIDGLRTDVEASTTMYYKPEGASYLTSWCRLPGGSPAGTPACENELPEDLPLEGIRSFAWTPGGRFGERVMTGFPDGISLRLEGATFKRVLALGASAGHKGQEDVGGAFGSAFSEQKEGWLGQEQLPVHLTLDPIPSKLASWPVSFRRALLAVAPAPEAAAGALSSEAVAVGDRGEVARYKPGEGWLPESLLSPGGARQTPRLRAVAWPTQERVYAVGDLGEMWLWRGETGLWEKDPATPLNFRGNLLGIAFDPDETSRGYAVGQAGVLLRYGKTWAQEPTCGPEVPQPCIPAAAAQASFSSIAFSGSEAIVAYRKLVAGGAEEYEGGLLVNDGSGWSIDAGAAAAIGKGAPWALAGLPDGGAAFTTEDGQIFERESVGGAWQATAIPYPGGGSPGSIALFREGGALRVIASGVMPDTFASEREPPPPPGFPPTLFPPFPIAASQERGVLRQTGTGWSDEEHELNNVKEPPGLYVTYDTVYQPDPVQALFVNSNGTQGWAVGGIVNNGNEQMDTSDVWRYPAEPGTSPPGVGAAPISSSASLTTLAVGGGAGCAAPCADLANAGIGPDVWLQNALHEAHEAGAGAFFYTGPRVTSGKTSGPATLEVPYARELARYRQLLSEGELPGYLAASSTELDAARNEATLASVFAGFPSAPGMFEGNPECSPSSAGCQAAYYALTVTGSGPAVRVIVLDESSPVGATQMRWLAAELTAAAGKEAAVVVGNANLAAAMSAHEAWAGEVVNTLIEDRASAYFYDSPEQNVRLPLTTEKGSVASFGSGTLGYVQFANQEQPDFIGSSGFLLAEVGPLNPKTGVFEVNAKLIPNVGELALEAIAGTLLRRSQAAVFQGLARRPLSGNLAESSTTSPQTDPYTPIPDECVGVACSHGLLPEYKFSSSDTEVGQFVKRNAHSLDPEAVLPGPKGEPIPDEEASGPGLFCAYNAGSTTVKIEAGGESASLPVTVEPGSVRQPCGTVHLKATSAGASQTAPPPAPAPAAGPPAAAPASAPPPVPPPPAAVAPTPTVRPPNPRPFTPNFFIQPTPAVFLPAFVPVPVPTPARPTPPSGTSAVTSPVEAPQREEEDEVAPESVSNEAVAYSAHEHEPSPAYLLGVIVLAAFAGASIRRRPRGRRRGAQIAPATLSSMRSQRQNDPRRGRRP